ncbi:taste receptor type 2 member 140-like [Phyllobates terribilis]|uniref:taste receptor type 2 member 140-like n=1 Tax=Phyllobates terribilis TaxID=111132 RepID=UPI003CCB115D
MTYALGVLSLAAVALTFCITLHLSVVIIHLWDWWNGRRLSTFDQILSSIALTNIMLELTICFDAVIYSTGTYVTYGKEVYMCDTAMFYFLLELHFWQTALLSIYYSTKLVNFSHSFFTWLKSKILTSPSHLVLALDITLFILALPLFWIIQIKNLENGTHHSSGNEEIAFMNNPYSVVNMVVGCCLPFTVMFACIGLSVRSLVSHVWRIRQNSSKFSSSPQIRAHVRAASTMVQCAAVNLSLFFNTVFLFQSKVHLGTTLHFIFWFIFMSHPTIQMIILIAGNSKLKSRLQIKCP